jgi:hypothetical protein
MPSASRFIAAQVTGSAFQRWTLCMGCFSERNLEMGGGPGGGGQKIGPDGRPADDGKRPRALALPLGVCPVSLRTPEGFFLCFFLSLSAGDRRRTGRGTQNHRKPKKNYPKNCASFAIAFPMFSRRKSLPEWIQK